MTGVGPRAPFWLDDDAYAAPCLFELHLNATDLGQRREGIIATLAPALARHHVPMGEQMMHPDAVTLEFEASGPRAAALFRELSRLVGALAADVAIVPAQRQIRLLACDMDGTVVDGETLDALAARAGAGEHVAAITDQAMRGTIDYRTALFERTRLLAGIDPVLMSEVAATAPLSAGAAELVAAARTAGVRTLLVTGGFEPIAMTIARRLGFDDCVCNRLETIDGRPGGALVPPIVDVDGKRAALEVECQRLGIDAEAVCAIGDGANDVAMLSSAGFGIAFRAKPVLASASHYRIDYANLSAAARWCGFPLP